MKSIIAAFLLLGCLFLLLVMRAKKRGQMYALAFRKRKSPDDFFWLDGNYCFEHYSVDTKGR